MSGPFFGPPNSLPSLRWIRLFKFKPRACLLHVRYTLKLRIQKNMIIIFLFSLHMSFDIFWPLNQIKRFWKPIKKKCKFEKTLEEIIRLKEKEKIKTWHFNVATKPLNDVKTAYVYKKKKIDLTILWNLCSN